MKLCVPGAWEALDASQSWIFEAAEVQSRPTRKIARTTSGHTQAIADSAGKTAQDADHFAADRMTVSLIERSLLVLLLVGLLGGVLLVMRPFATAIIFGASLATAAWPIRQALVHRGVGPGPTATILLMSSLALIGFPVLAIAPHLAEQLGEGVGRLQVYFAASPAQPAWLGRIPLVGWRLTPIWERLVETEGNLRTLLAPYGADIQQALLVAARALGDSVLQLILSLGVATMFWVNGDALVAALHCVAPSWGRYRRADARRGRIGRTRRRIRRYRNHRYPSAFADDRLGGGGRAGCCGAGFRRLAVGDQPDRRTVTCSNVGRSRLVAVRTRLSRLGMVHDPLGLTGQHHRQSDQALANRFWYSDSIVAHYSGASLADLSPLASLGSSSVRHLSPCSTICSRRGERSLRPFRPPGGNRPGPALRHDKENRDGRWIIDLSLDHHGTPWKSLGRTQSRRAQFPV